MQIDSGRLKSFLLDSDLIDKKDLEEIAAGAAKDGRSLDEAILNSGKIAEEEFRKIKAYLLGIPYISLIKERVPREVLFLIPEPIARRHNIVAFKKTETALEVAMLNPEDLEAIEFIKKGVGLKILPRLTDTDSIRSILLQYQKSLKAEFGDIIQKEAGKVTSLKDEKEADLGEGELKKIAEDVPIVRIVDTLLAHAVTQQASDIHIEPFEREVVIRYRLDGVLHDAMVLEKHIASGITARLKILSNLRLDEKRLPQDGRFKIDLNGERISFRVSMLPTYYGEKIVMRLLPDAVSGFTLEKGGFHGHGLEALHHATRQRTGMLLVTGPTGSGKSTTLYTLLDIINTPDVNISTIEDPIEYQLPRINQTQVKPDIGLTFAAGLRSLMRQDPDIIMVGEIRDRETVDIAIEASLTGHLVLSTIHTNSAVETLTRIENMDVPSFLVASTVELIIAQRLVRKLCQTCKIPATEAEPPALVEQINKALTNVELKFPQLDKALLTPNPKQFFVPKGCATCNNIGYFGRIAIYEVLRMNNTLRKMVLEKASAIEIEKAAIKSGMITLEQDGLVKALKGVTSLEEVYGVARKVEDYV